MREIIKENLDTTFAVVIGIIFAIIGIIGIADTFPIINPASAATETISVSATISQWISFSVSTNTVAITPDLVTSAGGTNIGSSPDITLTAGTNDADGYSIDLRDSYGGLCHSGGCSVWKVTSTDATLSAGTDGYGAQASSTDSDVTIGANYNYWGNNQVGDISSTTAQTVASTSGPSSSDQTLLKLKAAAADTDPDGTYSDTLTLTCLGNP